VSDVPGPDPATIPLATIGQRAVGKVIDSVLLALVLLPFAFRSFQKVIENPQDNVIPFWITATAAAMSLVYDWAFVAWRGQTLGGMVMKVRVVTVDAAPVSFSSAGIRALVPTAVQLVPGGFGGLLLLVVYGWAVFDSNRQGLHDKAAGTVVVPAGWHPA
jgi:uncharacterized RDD family membrane protein YckC